VQINNAGILDNDETSEIVVATLQTNYYGVKNVTKAVLPILRPSPAGARVIMASSALGQLHVCSLFHLDTPFFCCAHSFGGFIRSRLDLQSC